jgi:WD40 repeat protein
MLTKVPILIHLQDMKQVLPVVILPHDGIKQLLILLFFFLKTFRFSLHWIYFFHLFSPYLPASGKTICTGSDDASLRIWNPKSGENIHVVRGIHLYPAPFHVLNKLIYLVIT